MFPIDENDAYRKNDGSLTTIGDVIGSGGGGTLPIASSNTLGGVKIGNGINVTEDGTISASGGSGGSGGTIEITEYTTTLTGSSDNFRDVSSEAPHENSRLIGIVNSLPYYNLVGSSNVKSTWGICFDNSNNTNPNCFYCWVGTTRSDAKFNLIWWTPSE